MVTLPSIDDLKANYTVIVRATSPNNPMRGIGGIPFNTPYTLGNNYDLSSKDTMDWDIITWINAESKDYSVEVHKIEPTN